jgi:hypothetical protein
MSLIGNLSVSLYNGGCVVDLGTFIDTNLCPKINVDLPRPHDVDVQPETIIITSTEANGLGDLKPRDEKSDILGIIGVNLQNGGCIVGLGKYINKDICPTINIVLPKPHILDVTAETITVKPARPIVC